MMQILWLAPLLLGLACSKPTDPEYRQEAKGPQGGVTAWRAVIIWQTADAGEESEDWVSIQSEVTGALKKEGIFVTSGGSEEVEISKGSVAIPAVDCSGFLEHKIGYVFAMGGKEPAFQEHAVVDDVLTSASAYFGT